MQQTVLPDGRPTLAQRVTRRAQTAIRSHGYDISRVDWDQFFPFLMVLFRDLKIDVVLDVGAHYGEYAESLRDWGYKGHIISFEPARESFAVLQRASASDPRWTVLPLALSSQAGEATMYTHLWTTMSSLRVPLDSERITGTEKVSVDTLDNVMQQRLPRLVGRNIYLKLDTQGHDMNVIQGAAATMPRVIALQTELSLKPLYENMVGYEDAIRSLQALGFDIANLSPVARNPNLFLVEADCVMMRTNWRTLVNGA